MTESKSIFEQGLEWMLDTMWEAELAMRKHEKKQYGYTGRCLGDVLAVIFLLICIAIITPFYLLIGIFIRLRKLWGKEK